ncbi:MAG: hypothetical protein OHK93_006357 [Ramalina farinacea]|uniref:Myb-like domain-containing protein n=1 Tax=Ramalina farinacea TaxID=258253 RepID=A0AA43QY89_9LECA|nr:hypothetical protein [Ramalina farinacea]
MFMSFAGDGIIKTRKGEKAFVRKRSRGSSSSSTATPAAVSTKPAVTQKPDSAPPGPPVVAPWTQAEDDILRDMKATNKSWKLIGDHLPGRDVWTMKQRWKQLNAAKAGEGEGEKKDEGKAEEKKDEKEVEKEEKNDEKKEGKKDEKDDKKDDEKDDTKEDKTEEKQEEKKEEKKEDPPLKSALKTTKTETKADTAPKKLGDKPIIYMDKDNQCTTEDLHGRAEKDKWIEIASRFFDKTGKRVDPQYLKEKLANC